MAKPIENIILSPQAELFTDMLVEVILDEIFKPVANDTKQ
jgi:hypothetical protein